MHLLLAPFVGGASELTLFAGTEGGLSVYNAESDRFDTWSPDNTGMGSTSGIDALDCAPNIGALVIGYDLDGVDIWRSQTDEWTYYDPFNDIESSFALEFGIVGDLEEVWVAHIASVSVITPDGVTFYDDENGLDDLNTDDLEHFVDVIDVDANGTVWFGQSAGLTRVDGPGAFTFINYDDVPGAPFFSSVTGMDFAPDGTLWTTSVFDGVCVFDPASTSCLTSYEDDDGLASRFNSSLVVNDAGEVYYASEGDGVSKWDGSVWSIFLADEYPEGNEFSAINQVADGTILAGGFYGLQQITATDPLGDWIDVEEITDGSTVNVFFPQADGMWIGHSSGATWVDYADNSYFIIENNYDDPTAGIHRGSTQDIAIDGMGRVWFGTSSGITVWDGDTFTFIDLLTEEDREEGDSPRYVYSLLWDGTSMWAGTATTLFQFDMDLNGTRYDDTNTNLGFLSSVYDLALDLDGSMLVANGSRLFRHTGDGQFDEVLQADSSIRSIFVTPNGELWLGTSGAGAYHYDGSGWNILTAASSGLPSDYFGSQGILVDYLGNVWFATTDGGLLHYVP